MDCVHGWCSPHCVLFMGKVQIVRKHNHWQLNQLDDLITHATSHTRAPSACTCSERYFHPRCRHSTQSASLSVGNGPILLLQGYGLIAWWDKCINRQGNYTEKLQIYTVTAMLYHNGTIKNLTGNYFTFLRPICTFLYAVRR